MPAPLRFTLVTLLLGVTSSAALAQFGGGSMRGMAIGLAASTPVGDFEQQAQTGMGLVIHSGGSDDGAAWGLRSNFTFDRFSGKGTLDNVQFIGGGFDFVHRSEQRWYQFGGILLSNANYTYNAGTTATAGDPARARNGSNFGLTGGIGVNFGSEGGTRTFVEFAATTMFTGAANSNWFPIRFGLRF